jgi:predicted porin
VNVQLDAFGDAAYANEDDDNNYGTGLGVGAHINYRDTQGLLGVFAATGRSSGIDENTTSFFAGGLEGQWYCDSWTLSGMLGYLDSGYDEDGGEAVTSSFTNAGFARIGAAYYASKRLKLSADVSYADGEQDGDDATLWDWNAGIEYLFSPAVPASLYVEYRGMNSENEADNRELQSHGVNVGVRFHFGATDLMHADRAGASASLPAINRWVYEAGEALD